MLPLELRGARIHNLRGVDLSLRPAEVVALTGVSGAGKSSVALDTLYAEGQRRFVESFSPYARQFLERLERPPVDSLEPVPAGVAVDRASPAKSSRSTVGTMTDLEPLIAGLFARESVPHCPEHGVNAVRGGPAALTERLIDRFTGRRILLGYRLRLRNAEHYLTVRDGLQQAGYRRLWLDGIQDIDDVTPSQAVAASSVESIVDRLVVGAQERARLHESVETALRLSGGELSLRVFDADGRSEESEVVVEGYQCPECERRFPEPELAFFSFNSPVGACELCRGFGRIMGVDLDRVVPDPFKTLKGGAIRPWTGKSTTHERKQLRLLCARQGIALDVPFRELTDEQVRLILEGDGHWSPRAYGGLLGWFRWLNTKSYKMHVRVLLARYRSYDPCPKCAGARLKPSSLHYRVGGLSIVDWYQLGVEPLGKRVAALQTQTAQGALLAGQIADRLRYLTDVGLGYLSLDRQARTLSGGEAQRVTLTAALGTSLHNALFVLDEPSVGLHASDVGRLRSCIRSLAQRGNSVVLVEHDADLIRCADRVIELGPGAGPGGGTVTFDGSLAGAVQRSGATARALAPVSLRKGVREPTAWLRVVGASEHNLLSVDVDIPLGVFCALSGPSGSGKSTLAEDIVYRSIARRLRVVGVARPGAVVALSGAEAVKKVVLIDQSPLGRTSRGNAATYTKVWDTFRKLFAVQPAAAQSGLGASHFSFNVAGGRCDACSGEGYETVEMQFLADVSLLCPVCRGARFKEEVLRVNCRGFTVGSLLEATVEEACERFADTPAVLRGLMPLVRLGLGYLPLGQPLSTLSGGEAQRLKLARALSERLKGTLFVVDEPSAGLHADEVEHVRHAFEAVVTGGGSVLVVEHDLRLLAGADWIIELGPGAGVDGGRLCAAGPPEAIATSNSKTGLALKASLAALELPVAAPAVTRVEAAAIQITHAREHNLKQVSVSIPHQALTVVTGPSGSGKSSLIFDVLFAEGQRRFLETLSPYARRFLPTLPKPDVDALSGVPPAIALEQRLSRGGASSTVATVTELAHYLRLLFAKLGTPHCPTHGLPLYAGTSEALFERVREVRGKGLLLAPVVEGRKGTYLDVFNAASRAGITEAIVDGERVETDQPPRLARTREHSIHLIVAEEIPFRELSESALRCALEWGKGTLLVQPTHGETRRLATSSGCPECGFAAPVLDPRWFSFNTVQGQCPRCKGSGELIEVTRVGRGKQEEKRTPCPACLGARLHPIPAAVRLDGIGYDAVMQMSVTRVGEWVARLRFEPRHSKVSTPIVDELQRRLSFLERVGLGYLTLARSARTLSGGELQRLRLAAQLGAGLTGALYVLDEPTIGLHPRDTARLIDNLRALVALGSTVVVVEHDLDVIQAAHHLIDMGPTGGRMGGEVVACGAPEVVLAVEASPTAACLREPPTPRHGLPLPKGHPRLELFGVSENNLKDVDVSIPLQRLTVVCGVSGSGKSTLINRVLLPAVRQKLGLVTPEPGCYQRLGDCHELRRALSVDQAPIGRSPRSVPATFLGIWDVVRQLFANLPESRAAGFGAARFSFNSKGGRCEECQGQGVITHEMSFLPDAIQPCPVCSGRRFEPRTLTPRFRGFSVGDVLALSADEALDLFESHPKITRPLATLSALGTGYVQLGQGSHTLSGGEAQRLKLAHELSAGSRHEPTLYVLDEPTTGLHQADVARLLVVLDQLVARGDTVVVIEHHPLVIASADYILELGPEAGEQGGQVVAEGSCARVARRTTATGRVLKAFLHQVPIR